MSTRREFLRTSVAAGALLLSSAQRSRAGLEGAEAALAKNTRVSLGGRARIKSMVRCEDTVQRYAVNGDNWHSTWAADDRQYIGLCDGTGFSVTPTVSYNSRMLALTGGPLEAKFHDVPKYPMLGAPLQRSKDTRYYNFGTLALDGYLYQFMSTFNRVSQHEDQVPGESTDLLRFTGVKLIYSPNNGRTWHNQDGSTPVVWESWDRRSRDTMVFFEEDQEAFSLLSVLQMGRNYRLNRDSYVYVYAPNGNTEGTMNELVLFRAPKTKVLDRSSYEYFAGMRAKGAAEWSRDIEARAVIHTFPRGWVNSMVHPYAWHPSVCYNEGLQLYMMANWGMGTTEQGKWFGKPSYLGFWVADNPWGPWSQIHEESSWTPAGDGKARAYQPQIMPKWIAADGKSFWLAWTDFQGADREEWSNFVKEYGRKEIAGQIDEEDIRKAALLMREYMPYYSFNTQRVDLVLG